jgi:hypothetical protein
MTNFRQTGRLMAMEYGAAGSGIRMSRLPQKRCAVTITRAIAPIARLKGCALRTRPCALSFGHLMTPSPLSAG